MRIGLTRISGGGVLVVRPSATGKLSDPATGESTPLPANRPVQLAVDFTAGQVRARGAHLDQSRAELVLSGGLLQIGAFRYPGSLRVRLARTGLQVVNELDIEQYLEGVLPGELPRNFALEAQKALAVAARSYALVQHGKHGEFDLCDRTCCQVYLGYRRGSPRGLAAVRATRRLCLWSNDELVYAFYSADCGGVTTSAEEVPLPDKPARSLPYLRTVRDGSVRGRDYCAGSPFHLWTARLTREEVEERLNSDPETSVGALQDLRVLDYDPSGRVRTLLLTANRQPPTSSVSGWALRRAIGPLTLKSTLFRLDQPVPGVYRFIGRGFGHGLGLCQIGANGMAERGIGFRGILAHYYPGTKVAPLRR